MTGTDIRELDRRVKVLVDELRDLGAEVASVLLVLDALASTGLLLVDDEEGVASAAFFTRVAA